MSEHVDVMQWVRPKAWKLDWELRAGDRLMGTVSSPRTFGTSVTATYGDETYVMSRGGLRRPGAAVRRPGERSDLALLAFDSIGKGTISFPDASGYVLEREYQTDRWSLASEGGNRLFTVVRDTKGKYPSGKVEVTGEDKHLGPLLLLAWFVISTSEC